MGQPVKIAVAFAAGSANGICLSQTPLAAGNLTIAGALASGGIATLCADGLERQVLLTFAGNDAGRTFTIFGTNGSGGVISETLSGADIATSASVLYYRTVTRIAVDAATAGALTVGTNGVGASTWQTMNIHAQPVNIIAAVVVSGTVNYTLQYTYDNPGARNAQNAQVQPTAWDDEVLVSQTATKQTAFSFPIYGMRLRINSGDGTATLTLTQAGISGQ